MTDPIHPGSIEGIALTAKPLRDLSPPRFTSTAEERLHRKQRLAGALRIFGKLGFGEGVAGHITARDPEYLDHFWVNPFALSFNRVRVSDLLQAIIPLFELDSYAPPVVMMAAVEGDALDPTVEQRYRQALSAQAPCPDIVRIDRFAFYDRAQKAFAIVITGECAKYGNILLKKGVTP